MSIDGGVESHKRIARLFAGLLYATGVGLLALVLLAVGVLGQGFGPVKAMVLAFALIFLLLAPAAVRWLRPILAVSSTCFVLLVAFGVYAAVDRPVPPLDRIFKPQKVLQLWELNDRYGYGNRASTFDVGETREYNVRYTLDAEHCRRSLVTPTQKGSVLVLGDSFTFGVGVEDWQTYSWRLSEDHWPSYQVRNCGVNGWGTAHAYLRLQEILEGPDAPDLVIYAMIAGDLWRNYINEDWLKHVLGFHVPESGGDDARGFHPHFELEGGVPVLQGLIHLGQAVPASPEVREKEIALTQAFILGMDEMARARGGEFAFVILPQGNRTRLPAEIPSRLAADGVQVLDLSDRAIKVYSIDRHPTPASHALLAEWIAESPVSDLLH